MLTVITHSTEETEQLAEKTAAQLHEGDILAYRGGLGVGKTAFTRGLARGLGLSDPVSSPTFSLVHEYRGHPLSLFHFDMYRVTTPDDLYSTGFFDYLELPNSILAIEWSENIDFALNIPHIQISISQLEENVREIIIMGDERF